MLAPLPGVFRMPDRPGLQKSAGPATELRIEGSWQVFFSAVVWSRIPSMMIAVMEVWLQGTPSAVVQHELPHRVGCGHPWGLQINCAASSRGAAQFLVQPRCF